MNVDTTEPKRPIEILLVEDSLEDVVLFQTILKQFKYPIHISVARDGVEALDHLRRHLGFSGRPAPDLALLDLKLPRKDGHQVLGEIKGDPELKQIPVLVMTSSQAEADRRLALQEQANYYIVKPMDIHELFETFRYIESLWMENIS